MICTALCHLKLGGILSAASWLAAEPASPNYLPSSFPSFPWETSIQLLGGRPRATGKHLGWEAGSPVFCGALPTLRASTRLSFSWCLSHP